MTDLLPIGVLVLALLAVVAVFAVAAARLRGHGRRGTGDDANGRDHERGQAGGHDGGDGGGD